MPTAETKTKKDNNARDEKQEIKIDFSKISNLDKAAKENPAVDEFINKNTTPPPIKKEETISTYETGYKLEHFEKYPRKFDFVQAEMLELPSHGICYQDCDDQDVRDGHIWIYPMTMKEEEILSTNKYIYDGTATIMVLNNCIKSNISAMDLVVSDFYFLLLYLRKISISDKFSFEITCPACEHKFKYDIEISKQNFEELDKEKYSEPIRVDLEKTNYTVLLGLPRIRSVREMNYFINNSKTEVGTAEFLYTRTIAIISPNGEEVDKKDWILFYNNLPHSDSEKLFELAKVDNGLSHVVKDAICPNCGKPVEGSSVDLNTDALFSFQ